MTEAMADDRLAEIEADQDAMDLTEVAELVAEVKRLRAELAERDQLSTSAIRDNFTGLQTRCAMLHAADETDPLVKDVAWQAFGLISTYRATVTALAEKDGEIGGLHETIAAVDAERDRLHAEVEGLRSAATGLSSALNAATHVARTAALDAIESPISAVRELAIALTEADALTADEADRIHTSLDERSAHIERMAEQAADVRQAEAERDRLAEQVKRVEALRDRWEAAVRDPSAYHGASVVHAAALAASHLPDLRRALDGEEASNG